VFLGTVLGWGEKIASKLHKIGEELDTTKQLRRCGTARDLGEGIGSTRRKTGVTVLEAT
jgi:hypothetical protein